MAINTLTSRSFEEIIVDFLSVEEAQQLASALIKGDKTTASLKSILSEERYSILSGMFILKLGGTV